MAATATASKSWLSSSSGDGSEQQVLAPPSGLALDQQLAIALCDTSSLQTSVNHFMQMTHNFMSNH